MSTMNNGTSWNASITINKISGTKITIDTDNKYVDKDIELNVDVTPGRVMLPPPIPHSTIPNISVNSNTGVVTASVNESLLVGLPVIPGFVSSVEDVPIYFSGEGTLQLSTKSAQTFVPSTASQTISAGKYLTGVQTIAGDANLVPENIADGVSIFGVQGTHSGGGDSEFADFIDNGDTWISYENSSITKIRPYIFYGCTALTSVSFPACTSINEGAFGNCSALTLASFPVCKSIDMYVFSYCRALTSANFPSCTFIGNGAFNHCTSLTSVSFPVCTCINNGAFTNCTALTSVSFPSCTSINDAAFTNCSALTSASFPACTSIGGGAFYSCNALTSANFPSCTFIGNGAFNYCTSLTSVSFPVCKSISGGAFARCNALTSVNFPSCTFIGSSAFYSCTSLASVSFPVCESIGSSAFSNCSALTSASFPACTSIGNSAFYNCYKLLSLYLTGFSYVTLGGSSVFRNTPIGGYTASTGGVYGSIYVPLSMLERYKSSRYWSYFSSRMVGI